VDQELPTQALSAVPHFAFSIFNVGVPNLIFWGLVVVAFFAAAWLRLPRLFEGREKTAGTTASQPGRRGEP
jgi:hypothetical protein